jgi:type I restriction-modification system DNA methylase subunit
MPDAPASPTLPLPDSAREAVAALVAKYRQNEDQYRSAAYNETQCRREFIDPFFEALGWDVQNRAGNAEQYKDVLHEASLKVGEATKAPDYAFRLGGVRKFYVEAKKPSVRIHDEPTTAYQLRRYAWSAKLPLSILTDFDEFAVYDCRQRPNASDAPAVGRVKFLRFHEYADELDYLYSTFSPEAIRKGSFDRYVEDKRRHRGTAEVDAAFLADIEAWREALAKDIARHNAGLSVDDLNFAVQATIDRLLFLRIAEDRGVEEYGRLRVLLGGTSVSLVKTRSTGGTPVPQAGSIYPSLLRLYHEADAKYNAGLFDFSAQGDTLCPQLTVSDKVLKPIIRGLYYPDSPYEFSVLGADILGAVYEQFLGKVIRLTPSGMAKVEEKPEVKKAGGVYYTPRYIVDYIVEHTVGEALKEAGTPEQASALRILDPACGSGSFLLGAYDYLLRWHLDYYTSHDPDRFSRGEGPHGASSAPSGPRRRRRSERQLRHLSPSPPLLRLGDEWRLSSSERKRILLNNLYGVDLDPQAVEVTKLNLLLKCMEGDIWPGIARQLKLLHDRVLPNIDGNIKCGNSLIGPDYFHDRVVIDPDEERRVRPFDWAGQHGFPHIMKAGGFDCVIGNPPYINLKRGFLSDPEKDYLQSQYETATGQYDAFAVFLEKALRLLRGGGIHAFIVPKPVLVSESYEPVRRLILGSALQAVADCGSPFEGVGVEGVVLVVATRAGRDGLVCMERVERRGPPVALGRVTQGSLRALPFASLSYLVNQRNAALVENVGAAGISLKDCAALLARGIETGKSSDAITERPGRRGRPLLRGEDVTRYRAASTGLYYQAHDGNVAEWKDRGIYECPGKLIIRRVANRIIAALDVEQRWTLNTLYSLIPSSGVDARYLLGCLNSSLLSYWFGVVFLSDDKLFPYVRISQLENLPIRPIAFSDPSDVARHDKMVSLVDRMLDLHKRLPEAKTKADRDLIERRIAATDDEIDALVYELYGLTDEEIAIVRGGT